MTHQFKINKSKEVFEQQLRYLLKRVLDNKIMFLKAFALSMIIISILVLSLVFFTSSDRFIELKSVMIMITAIGWLLLLLSSVSFFFSKYKYKWFLKTYLGSISEQQLNYQVEIDEDKVKIFSESFVGEYSWAGFVSFGIYNNTIYVLNKSKPIESLYWSREEMGDDKYLFLIELLKKKSIHQQF